MSMNKVIEIARADLGYTEDPPGSNWTKYWEAYDPAYQGQPWCVAFLWWLFNEAGERMAFFGGGKTASCGMLLRWYEEQGLTVPVSQMQVGDIVILNFNGKGTADHCGLVTGVGFNKFDTIEGNTTPGLEGSQDNGGCVAAKRRQFFQVVAVCRPQYSPDPQPVDDVSGHWAEKAIRRCMERGLMKGYPDGSFQPDKPVTRAALAVILDRLNKEDDLK